MAGPLPSARSIRLAAAPAVLLAILAFPCRAEEPATGSPTPAGNAPTPAGNAPAFPVHPLLTWRHEAPFLGTGALLLGVGVSLGITRQEVPDEGLDPEDVNWSFDRDAIGKPGTEAERRSDDFRDAALAYPMIATVAWQSSDERWIGTLRRSAVYFESLLLAEGVAAVMKNSADRPRPYNYLPIDERPDDSVYDVTMDEAFRSMPSGHATVTFCAAAFATTDHLLSRPRAGWFERAGVPFVGGFLAGMTADLRVAGGQHFPSDVLVGGAIGTAGGVGVPLLHRYVGRDRRQGARPSGAAVWQAIAGHLAGVGAGILVAETIY